VPGEPVLNFGGNAHRRGKGKTMKRAKLFLIGHAGVEKSRNAARRHRVRTAKKRPEPDGLYGNFGGLNEEQPPPIDAMIMPSLNAALAQLPEGLDEACLQRSLLPHTVLNHLVTARFLSFFLLSARSAQEGTGVRASILLADAVHIAGGWADKHVADSNDIFETGRGFSTIHEAFVDRARWLRKNRKFRAVMRSMCDPAECLKQLGRCELWDKQQRFDRVSTIIGDCLQECDALPGERRATAEAAS
jgi:hypothetical protein